MSRLKHYRRLADFGAFSGAHALAISALAFFSLGIELIALILLPAIVSAIVKSQGVPEPEQFKGLLDRISEAVQSVGLEPTTMTFVGLFGSALILRQLITFAESALAEKAGSWSYLRMSEALFRAWTAAPITEVSKIGVGTWVSMLSRHCSIASQIVPAYARMFRSGLTVATYLGAAFWIQPRAVLFAVGYVVVILLPVKLLVDVAKRASRRVAVQQDTLANLLADCAAGWRQIRIFKLAKPLEDRFADLIKAVYRSQRAQRTASGVVPVLLIFGLFAFIYLVYALANVLGPLDTGNIAVLVVAAIRILPLLQVLTSRSSAIVVSAQSLDHITELRRRLDVGYPEVAGTGDSAVSVRESIAFRNVSFRYGADEPLAINGINLEIPAGKVVAVCGPSGSGKSTFVDLISSFLVPSSGTLLYDGVDCRRFGQSEVLNAISLATQEPFVFQGTLRENIAVGRPGASFAEIVEAAKRARIHDAIEALPKGYDTRVGQSERGLSGGQRQRISLARIFLSNARVLIFDEPTSAMDVALESQIIDEIKRHTYESGRTALIITHRPSVWSRADVVIRFDGGSATVLGVADHAELKAD